MSTLNQEIPEGYKQTEVGVIPEDWDCVTLGDLGDIVRGGSPRPAGDPKYFNGNYIPWLTVASLTNIPTSKQEVTSTLTKLTELGSKQSRILDAGTLIISNSGATLGVAKILGLKCCANDGVAAIINQKKGNKSFITHYINTQTKRLHDDVATGNGQPNLNTDLIKLIPIPFPSESEQTVIANALSDLDALLTELEKLIAKKQAIKTATMQQLLTGKTRLPQFATYTEGEKQGQLKGTKPSELGEIPEDWDVQTVYELAEGQKSLFDDGDWIEAEYITDKGVRLIQTGNIGVGRYQEKENKKYISESSFIKLKCKELKQGDLLICRLAEPAGRACIFPDIGEEKIITSVDVTIFRPPVETVNREYLLHYFSTNEWFSSVLEQVGGTTHKRISRGALGRIRVPMPKLAEQTAIATILSDMDNEIQTLEQRLAKTRQIKQGMMQELLTGRTRLPFEKE